MKIYISGPITGLPYNEVESCFNKVEKELQLAGYETVNPINNGLPKDSTWKEHMRADLRLLLDCDAIYMLEGWERSIGAMIEYDLALKLHLAVLNW